MNKINIYTAAGGMEICYLMDLPDKIARNKIQNGRLIVPSIKKSNAGVLYNENPWEIISQQITQAEYKLNEFYRQNAMEQVDYKRHYLEDQPIYKAEKNQILLEFKTMLAKKTPFAFIKDLNLKKIDELSNEYAIKFGDNDFIGVEANLSPYQKFFSIINLSDLIFYMVEFKDITSDSTIYKGKLINVNPDNWICYRYENLEYLKELNQLNYFNRLDNK